MFVFEYVWGGVKIDFLKCVFFFVFCLKFQREFVMGVIGITHPWIGKKWPCTGEGLQLDSNSVESLLRMRRQRE